jgi:hypothetical protein
MDIWEQGVLKPDGFLTNVQGDAGLPFGDTLADHGSFANLESVVLADHLSPGIAGTGLQHRELPFFIEQEQANVVEIEAVAHQVYSL